MPPYNCSVWGCSGVTHKKSAPESASHNLNNSDSTASTVISPDIDLNSDHLAELHASAISDETIAATGVYTASTRDELPEPLRWIADRNDTLPALVYPMVEAGRGVTWQVKPQPGSLVDEEGRPRKYICPKKEGSNISPSFIERRPITSATRRVLVVEGTKQALAAMTWTDDTTAVYCIPGIQTWMGGEDGPNPAFARLKGQSVYIIPDADAGSNRAVYDGAQGLGEHCKAWGASPVRFVRMPGHGSQGLDDVLATVDDGERSEMLELWIRRAQAKPASKMPKRASKKQRSNTDETRNDSRPKLHTDLPPETLWDRAWEAIESKHAGVTLFRQDSRPVMISRRDGQAVLVPVDRATGRRLAAAAFDLVRETDDSTTVVAPMDKDIDVIFTPFYTDSLPPLHSVTRSPLVTETGEIITRSGYHKGTGVYVDLDDSLTGISVPDKPSDQDVENAKVLLEDVLYDFPWVTPADRTRALGALLTPLARPMLTTAPMHVISAVRRSSGKGLLTDVFHLIATGETAAVQDLPGTETEMRKVIASKLFAGAATLFLDECSVGVDSKALSALLTAESYTDRILGESRMISVQNNLCVYAAGNNIAVDGDLARRVVPILLDPKCSRPESRSGFRHPHLRRYVRAHRRELLAAALTLIRAWAVAGRPSPNVAGPFGSFEGWYHVVGGTLEHVGYADLTTDLEEIRARYNASEQENAEHLAWLYEAMEGDDFRAFDAECKIADSRDYVPLPEGLVSLDEVSARRLGRVYSRLQGAWIGGYCLESAGVKHHTKLFHVVCEDDWGGGPGPGAGPDNSVPPEPSTPATPEPSDTDSVDTLVFDLETGRADHLHVTDDPGFVRLATYSINGAEPVATTDIAGELLPLIERAGVVVGHNIVQYDLAALQRLYGLDVEALVKSNRVHDTLVMARLAAGGAKNLKYDLNAVASRYGVGGKLLKDGKTVLDAQAEQFGGFDKIPTDHPDYVKYALQDVRANTAVYSKLLPETIDAVGEEYLQREHEKTYALSVVEAKGIRVDTGKVEAFFAEEEQTKSNIRQWLVDTVGMPDEGTSPWASVDGKQAIADYFGRFGAEVPRTKKGGISISGKAMQELAKQHAGTPEVVELATRMQTLLQASTPAATIKKYLHGDRVYPSIKPSQNTGRLSTKDPGMTVFGSRDKRLIRQREMILSDSADEVLISVDLSQIDARCMAAGSGDERYSELFALGRDAHTEMAVRVFGDKSRRSEAKALGHAANYGMGPKSFADHAGISVVEARSQLDRLHREFPELESFKESLRKSAETRGWVSTGFGRRVAVARDRAYTQAPAAYGQGTARDVFLEGVLNLPREVLEMVRIFVHDEIILSVPRERAEGIKECVVAAFKAVELPSSGGVSVPVLSDSGGPGDNWSECK